MSGTAEFLGRIVGFVIVLIIIALPIVAIIILIVWLVRRGNAQAVRPPVPLATPLPPAGYYPDPERLGQQRYWDGTAWAVPDAPPAQ